MLLGDASMLIGRGPYILLQKKMPDLFYENYRRGSLQTQELWVQKMFENNLTESRWTTHSFTCPAVISMPINECTALYFMFILLCPYTCSIAYCKFQQKKMKTFPEGKKLSTYCHHFTKELTRYTAASIYMEFNDLSYVNIKYNSTHGSLHS